MANEGVLAIAAEDVRSPEVLGLVAAHLAFANEVTPEGHVHALDAEALARSGIRFFGARRGGELVAIGALRAVGDSTTHVELKSMHTRATERGRGVGRALLAHLMEVAASEGFERASLETGTMEAFAPARGLYHAFGFEDCAPFADYSDNPFSVCMTRTLPAGS